MAANIDLQKSSRITLNRDGYRAVRVAMVSGVAGNAAQVLYNAINDAALPDIGDAHPDVSTITLQEISCDPLGGGQFKVTMTYYKDEDTAASASVAQATASVALGVEESATDIDGNPMVTYYRIVGSSITQRFVAEVERPRTTFQFTYQSSSWPTTELQTYPGKINSVAWNGYPVGTIFCTGIEVNPEGDKYGIRFGFAYRPEGWQFQAKTRYGPPVLLNNTKPDYELDLDTGIRPFTVYTSIDFNPLGFTFDSVAYTNQYLPGVFRITGSDATLTVS